MVDELDGDALKAAVEKAVQEARENWEEEVAGLKANSTALLKEKKALATKVKGWEELGIDLEEMAKLKAEAEEKEATRAKLEGDWEAREKQLKENLSKQIEERETRIGQLMGALDKEIRRSKAMAAIAKHAPDSVDLLLPHVLDAVSLHEQDGDFQAVVKGPDGQPKLMTDPQDKRNVIPMTVEAYVETLRERFPAAFPGSGGAGSSSRTLEATGAGGVPKRIDGADPNFNDLFIKYADQIAKGEVVVDMGRGP